LRGGIVEGVIIAWLADVAGAESNIRERLTNSNLAALWGSLRKNALGSASRLNGGAAEVKQGELECQMVI
jgi:hypothetical protein